MSIQLVIAEKPSVARSIAGVIGAKQKQDGYMEGNGYLVSWCIGHLVSLADAGAYNERFKKWSYDDLPILPQQWQYIIPAEKKKQFEILRFLMERPDVESLVCDTDAGREGELIFRFVYQMAGCKKPFKRLWISSMEDAAIREGFQHLHPGADYDALYQSALCRAQADWLVGLNATRLFSILYHKTLTVGRVQTPTLKMLVDREDKISGFKKEKYHVVHIAAGGMGRTASAFSTPARRFDGLTEGEKKLLSLVCCKLLCAVAAPHVFEAVTATFTCAGNEFTSKGKTILTPGWKEIDRRFRACFKADADAPELARELPEITEGQTFDKVEASVTEHFTTPPKPYTEDTLLSAMERAGAEDMPEDAERQGLGTPATRASILEKLVQMGVIERRGKQLLPTKDGHNLACVLPNVLTSPKLTAEWETKLTAIAKGEADPDGFMADIEEMTRGLIVGYSQISEDAQKLFQAERVVIGKCPRCGEAVYEGKKNYYCGNRACQFVMWKNDRFFEERGKAFTPKIAAALLKDGTAKVKGLRSIKTGKPTTGRCFWPILEGNTSTIALNGGTKTKKQQA
ncbi:hypothetical protein CE91St55_23920 [Hungatella hathewayi]|uniref:DNA topoisomerase n=1 Tax=Hungatella hathewayi TaxID=154046 RepID=A0AA37JKF6_9FIRM|nr:hypothetical protein CE91St55_23920 [Hungatella hathewayi]